MNKERRKRLAAIWSQLEEISQEEQDAYDNMPESLQASEKGEDIERNVDDLEEAKDIINSILESDN